MERSLEEKEPGATLPTLPDRIVAYAWDFIEAETGDDKRIEDRVFGRIATILSATVQPGRVQTMDTMFEYLASGFALHETAVAVRNWGNGKRADELHGLAQICLHHATEDLAAVAMATVYEMHEGEWMQ